jgi:hypothetical protein
MMRFLSLTLQLHASLERAWAAAAAARPRSVPPLLHGVREVYTEACERVTHVSRLHDGDRVIVATHVDLRPTLPTGDMVRASGLCCASVRAC